MAFGIKGIAQISPSNASRLLSCAARAARASDTHYRGPRSTSAALGNACHEVAALVHKGRLDDLGEDTLENALHSAWRDAVQAQRDAMEEALGRERVPPLRRWRGFRIAETSFLSAMRTQVIARRAGTAADVLAVEEWLESASGVFGGRVDLVTEQSTGVRVVDLKSGRLPSSKIPRQYEIQLML